MNDNTEVTESVEEHKIIIDPVGFISEVINNIRDYRDIIRELISNAASKEIGAKRVEIKVYGSDKGLAITVSDDGRGMNYTKNNKIPGRLDKFLNAAQGKQAGFESDEFGAKGLGTKLLWNSDFVEIVTGDGEENVYRVILNEPYKTVVEGKKLFDPFVSTISANKYPFRQRGTSITVKGWAGLKNVPKDFKFPSIERYLRYFSVIGYTKMEKRDIEFPEFVVSFDGQQKSMKVGFPFILPDDQFKEPRTMSFNPVEVTRTTSSGKKVKILLKGGMTLDTSHHNLTEETGGVWLSVNGIPYFKLLKNKYARQLNLSDDFIRFVVECDDVNLNMSRSDFAYDEKYETFDDALHEAFDKIKADPKFHQFDIYRKRESKILTQDKMNKKKDEFSSEDKRYVWVNGKMILAEPESEYDTASVLWILEGMGKLPFTKFKTLQYAGYIEGIDMLIDFQEEEDKEKKVCIYAELEKSFSNIVKHKHDIGQMSLALCWEVDSGKVPVGKITKTLKPYKYSYSVGDITIPVFAISQFPEIFIGTKKEAQEQRQ